MCKKALLTLFKAVTIPLELVLISLLSLVNLISPKRLSAHLVSLRDGIWEIVKITWHLQPENYQSYKGVRYLLITPRLQSDKPPIFYAPGYLDSPNFLTTTCQTLADQTERTVYIVEYRRLFQSINEHARDLACIIEASGEKTVVLVGHSMGGLTSGRYIQKEKSSDVTVERWITIGSPLLGSRLAYFAIGTCARELEPGSELIGELSHLDMPSLHIYSLTDGAVRPESARGMHGSSYECRHPYSHVGIRSKPEVLSQIATIL